MFKLSFIEKWVKSFDSKLVFDSKLMFSKVLLDFEILSRFTADLLQIYYISTLSQKWFNRFNRFNLLAMIWSKVLNEILPSLCLCHRLRTKGKGIKLFVFSAVNRFQSWITFLRKIISFIIFHLFITYFNDFGLKSIV